MPMEDDDLNKLANLLVSGMKNHHAIWIDPEVHADQHEFLGILMQERRDKLARRKAIEDKVAGSLILSFLMGVLLLLGTGSMDWIREHLK